MTTAWQDKTLPQKILDQQSNYESIRSAYDDRFADIMDFCEPGQMGWTGQDVGEFRGVKIYEGTPPWALRTMTDGWLGNLVSEVLRWLKYLFPDRELRDNDQVNQWIQDNEDQMYYVYRNSDLYCALAPFTRSAFSVGSPVIIPYLNEQSGKIKCEVPHPRENYYGAGDGYHRVYKMSVLDAVRHFMGGKVPDEGADIDSVLSPGILADYRNGRHNDRHVFIRAIYPSDHPILDSQPAVYRNRPWMEFYIEKDATDAQLQKPLPVWRNGTKLDSQGHETKPYIRWDYEIDSANEFYARTPSWNAIHDIRSGQELAKQLIEAGQLALHKPIWAHKKFKGHFSMAPKARNYYGTDTDRQLKPEVIDEAIQYPIGKDIHDMVKASVERHYHIDLFAILARLAEQKKGWPTATHIIHLNAEKATLLAPRIGRFNNVLHEIDDRFFDIERRRGGLPDPPDIVLEWMAIRRIMTGETKLRFDMEFLGPLAQMQQRGLTLGRAEAGLAILERYIGFDPLLLHKVKLSTAMERDLEHVGFPQDSIVPESEYQELLAAIAQAKAEEMQAQQIAGVVEAVPKLSKTIEPGSPLAQPTEAV